MRFILIGIFALIHILAYFSLIKSLHLKKLRVILGVLLCINFLGIVGYFSVRYVLGMPHFIFYLLSISIGIGFILLLSSVLYWILRGINSLIFSRSREIRHRVWIRNFIFAFVVGYSAWGMIEGGLSPRVEKVEIDLAGLKQQFSAVQLSDIHIGGLVDEEMVRDIVNKTNALNPDVIFLTGDIIDIEVKRAEKAIKELVKLQAPLGIYYILGNHEYYNNATEIIEYMRQFKNITLLENSSVVLQKNGKNLVNIAGVYDLAGRRYQEREPDIKVAMQSIYENIPTILLAHQPKMIEEVRSGSNKIDLMLSGHTHGGQIFPFRFVVGLVQPYLRGLYRDGDMLIYVNVGSGFWGPPMRIGMRAEITHYNFKPL